jgi:hypothetical protein
MNVNMLKYKDFVSTVLKESADSKTPKWVEAQKAAYSSWKPDGRWITPKGGEILRADIGTDDPEGNIQKFMSLCGIPKTDYEISPGNYSGKFDSWSLNFLKDHDFFGKKIKKDDNFGIVNAVDTSKGVKQVIGDKDLTPDKLGLAGDYPNQNAIVTAAKTAIKSAINDQVYQDFCIELVDAVSNYSAQFKNVDEVEGINKDFVINHDFSSYAGKIDPKSIKTIEKDFGEVLGGIFMFDLITDTGVGLSFPKESNLELVDFFFNGLAVSSKAGHGAKASATGYINAINRSMKVAHWVPTADEQAVIDYVLKPLSAEPKERANTTYLKRSRSSATFSNTVNLFNIHLMKSKNSGWNYFLQESGLNANTINRDDIIHAFIDMKSKKKLHKFLSHYIALTSLNTSERGKSAALLVPLMKSRNEAQAEDALNKIIFEGAYDILIGLIMYGCSKQLQVEINTNYASTLTSIINKSLSVKQLYLDTKIGKNLINFAMRAMENSDFEIGTLNGIDSWGVKAITISMKK